MQATCPHCGKTIELVGAEGLREEYGLSSNQVQHARDQGKFPAPWLALGNRMIYLRADIETYRAERDGMSARKAVDILKSTLTQEQLEEVLAELKAR